MLWPVLLWVGIPMLMWCAASGVVALSVLLLHWVTRAYSEVAAGDSLIVLVFCGFLAIVVRTLSYLDGHPS